MPCFHYEGEDGEPVPPNVEQVILGSNLETLPANAFYLRGSLVQVDLGFTVKTIGSNAFCGCHSLATVELPASVQVIERVAFAECLSLQEIQMKEGLIAIGVEAFASCASLERIEIPSTVEMIEYGAFGRCESLVEAILPEGGSLTYIGSDVFLHCTLLQTMEIPSSVESLGENVFSECTSLIDMQLHNRLLEMERGFLFGCTSLPRIAFPETTENIAFGALWNCGSLTLVELNEGLLQIDDYAFRNCVSLQAIAIPESVKMIGIRAFRSCIHLVYVELPRHMNINLMDEAFADCQWLVNIAIPSSSPQDGSVGITAVAQDCFVECTVLLDFLDRENMIESLEHRFEGLPIHQLCYYASSTEAVELVQLVSQMDDPTMLDPFGMTPFHVLFSAAKSRSDLLQVLLNRYPSHWIGHQDALGRRATDYIGSNNWTNDDDDDSSSKSLMRMALESWMLDWLSNSSEDCKSDIIHQVEEIVEEEDMEQRSRLLDEAYKCFFQYQRIEMTFLLEIALWKQQVVLSSSDQRNSDSTTARGLLRVRCGAPIVVPNVLAYL